jgi:hypothetical protein
MSAFGGCFRRDGRAFAPPTMPRPRPVHKPTMPRPMGIHPRPIRIVAVGEPVDEPTPVLGGMGDEVLGLDEPADVDLGLRVADAEPLSGFPTGESVVGPFDAALFANGAHHGFEHPEDVPRVRRQFIEGVTPVPHEPVGQVDVGLDDFDETRRPAPRPRRAWSRAGAGARVQSHG